MTCTLFKALLPAALFIASLPAVAQQGTPDPAFGTGGMFIQKSTKFTPRDFASIAIQPDNKILAGSKAMLDPAGPYFVYCLSRFNANGTPDAGFGQNGTKIIYGVNGSAGDIREIFVRNNRIILAGTSWAISRRMQLIGLKTDGTIDPSFGNSGTPGFSVTPPTTPEQWYTGADIAPDGSIYMTGWEYSNQSNKSRTIIAKYKPNGTLDSSWQTNGTMYLMPNNNSTQSRDIKVLYTGKILVTGTYNPQTAAMGMFLMQLNHDGTPDNSFGTAGFISTSEASGLVQDPVGINIDTDNSIILAAGTYEYPPYTTYFGPYLTKYTANGTLATGFGTNGKSQPQLAWGSARFLAFATMLQPDHKILIAGYANAVDSSRFFISRFLPNGSLDSNFGSNGTVLLASADTTGPNHTLHALALQPDGKIVAGGTSGNTIDHWAVLLRLNSTFVHVEKIASRQLSVYPNPAEHILQIEGLKQGARYTLNNSLGATVSRGMLEASKATIDVSMLAPGVYFLDVQDEAGASGIYKIVKK